MLTMKAVCPCRSRLKTIETTVNQAAVNQASSLLLETMPPMPVVVSHTHAAGQMHGQLWTCAAVVCCIAAAMTLPVGVPIPHTCQGGC
jgi:hypothetical protein